MEKRAIIWLRVGFIAGAVVDALAVLPMVIPFGAKLFWGFSDFTGMYYFAQGIGAPLMLGWTLLLLWAYKKPMERRFVSMLTLIVVLGIAIGGVVSVCNGYVDAVKMIPTFIMWPIWITLFGYGFYISGKALKTAGAR